MDYDRQCNRSGSAAKKIAYAVPAFFLAVFGIPIHVYIPKFYSELRGYRNGQEWLVYEIF